MNLEQNELSSGPTHGNNRGDSRGDSQIPVRITASGACCFETKRIIVSVITAGIPAGITAGISAMILV